MRSPLRLLLMFALCCLMLPTMLCLTACSDSGDPTFASVCKTGDKFVYPVGSDSVSKACADPQTLAWTKVPLSVQMDADVADSYTKSVSDAINFWNSNVGVVLFTLDKSTNPDVNVVIGSASDPGNGATYHDTSAGWLHATVEIRQPGDVTQVYYIMAHELGHVLGLAHDANTYASIMYPVLDYTWDGVGQNGDPVDFRIILVTSHDRDALRARYRHTT